MKRLKYIFPLLLVLVLGTVLPGPAGAEGSGWSWDGSAEGVTLTTQGDQLLVSLDLPPGEYSVWVIKGQDIDNSGLPLYMYQHTGNDSFQIAPGSRLNEINGLDMTLIVYGSDQKTRQISVRYDAPAQAPGTSPAPSPSPSPSQGGAPAGGGSTTPAGPASPGSTAVQFTDTAGHWGEAYINEAAARGLFSGHDDGRFAPDDAMTRAQFITVLWRMAGRPGAADTTPFTDTGGEIAEFRSAIAWGYDRGYVNGDEQNRFAPSDPLTREQAMKILFYFSGGSSGGASGLYDVYDRGYADSSSISSWAREPMYWGVYNRIISGIGDGLLSPRSTATRAQLAKILIVYMDEVA